MNTMTDVEKRNVVKSIVAKSNLVYDLDNHLDKENFYENIMGSDYFFVLSNKQKNDNERKELYVIVDENYAFVQITTFALKDGKETSRFDEIVRFRKTNTNELYVESAKLKQIKIADKEFADLHSIGEMAKVDSNFDDEMVERKFIKVSSDFKFTSGFASEDTTSNPKADLIGKYIQFNLNLKNAI